MSYSEYGTEVIFSLKTPSFINISQLSWSFHVTVNFAKTKQIKHIGKVNHIASGNTQSSCLLLKRINRNPCNALILPITFSSSQLYVLLTTDGSVRSWRISW